MITNMLELMFQKQKDLREKLDNRTDEDYVRLMTLACVDELMEALHEVPWKPWKKNQKSNVKAMRNELVDALHFFLNLCIASEMGAEELFERYMEKNKINHQRKEGGY